MQIHTSSSPSALQGAPEASNLRIHDNMPNKTEIRFTIRAKDYWSATTIFDELATSKGIRFKQESEITHVDDFGGGFGLYDVLHFSFKPDTPDGSFSPALKMKINAFRREFQEKLDEAGIRNFAPAE